MTAKHLQTRVISSFWFGEFVVELPFKWQSSCQRTEFRVQFMAFNAEYFGKQLHLSNWLCDEMCQGYGGLPRLREKTRGETLMCNDQKCKTGEKKKSSNLLSNACRKNYLFTHLFPLTPEGSQSTGLVIDQHPKACGIWQMLTNMEA